MLGKLIKNEFKATAHSMGPIYLSALITFCVMLIFFVIKNKPLMVISSVALAGICIAALIVTLIAIIGMFNKSLYGNQGYLSFTLPVSARSLLGSKTIVSLCWVVISFVFAIAVTCFIIFYWVAQTSESVKGIIETVYNALQSMQGMPDSETAIKSIIVILVYVFIKALFLIFKVSFSLTIANTKFMQKMNTILAAILVYFGIYIVLQVVTVLSTYIPFYVAVASKGIALSINDTLIGLPQDTKLFVSIPIVGPLFEIVVCGALYAITGNIMTKHVNIK
ncbi:MAG: hypothetical protein K6F09_07215 [Clostridiales bacterium]|nr:hypothetical protein [Clostridiales bacterium]